MVLLLLMMLEVDDEDVVDGGFVVSVLVFQIDVLVGFTVDEGDELLDIVGLTLELVVRAIVDDDSLTLLLDEATAGLETVVSVLRATLALELESTGAGAAKAKLATRPRTFAVAAADVLESVDTRVVLGAALEEAMLRVGILYSCRR